jgi:hypothetical protein
MVTILSAVVSIFAFRFRSRASLELKLIALQHQLAVLRRQRPGRPQLSSLERLLYQTLCRPLSKRTQATMSRSHLLAVAAYRSVLRQSTPFQSSAGE